MDLANVPRLMAPTIDAADTERARFARDITAAWEKSRESIFEIGRLLIEAKAKLPHGSFEAMIESDLPFTPSTAQKLMLIARDQKLVNPAHARLLPPHWATLHELAKLPDKVFEAKIADGTIHPLMERSHAQTIRRQLSREAIYGALGTAPLPDDAPVQVGYVDPPWVFGAWSEHGMGRAACNHYRTMPTDEICKLKIPALITNPGLLLMWRTAPNMMDAVRVLDDWGFEYLTEIIWHKTSGYGMGHWTRVDHEALMICKRGNFPAPATPDRFRSLVQAPRGEHSAKPHIFYKIIDRMFPGTRKREFFGRCWCKGWEKTWGNQAPDAPNIDPALIGEDGWVPRTSSPAAEAPPGLEEAIAAAPGAGGRPI